MPMLQSSTDTLFDLLSNRRRRYVLYYIDKQEETVITLDELSVQVTEWEQQWGDATEQSGQELQNDVRIALHHNHLPRIADAGFIEYDVRSETVRRWDDPSLMDWAQEGQKELPYIRALFCTSVTG